MDWKDFLKPVIAKIILFVIIFVAFVPFIEPHEFVCFAAPCPQPGPQSLLAQFLFLRNPVVGIYYTNLFAGLMISYLLSCLIVFGANMLKRKRNPASSTNHIPQPAL
jgi:hypothetical protein